MYYISRLRVQCNKPDEGQANADDEIMNIADFIVSMEYQWVKTMNK